jgi:hypothetical protein
MNKKTSVLNKYINLSIKAIFSTFNRFPITMLLFIGFAVLIIYRIEVPYEKVKNINDILDRLMGVMALGISVSLSCAMLLERLEKDKNTVLKIGSYALMMVFLSLYYLFLFTDTNMVSMTRLFLLIMATILSFLFIPYLPKKERFEIYVTNIITSAATTAFYTIVLALGVMAILFAIESLLYSGMNERVYLETWVVAWLVVAPFHFLYNLPDCKNDFSVTHFSKIIKIMLLYIVLPVMTVYTMVLYAYFGKIIITQIWPKGIVSYLVVSYTAVGIASIFLITPFKDENKWVRVFTAVFTKAIFPLLAMMFISIGIRIGEFGFTENRYFIMLIGLWSTLVMIYLNFSKGKNNVVLPVSLAVVAFLAVVGPWNAFEVSKNSQSNRFYQIAVKYDLIQNGKVVKTDQTLTNQDRREITGILSYFNRSHDLSELKYLPENFTMDQMKSVFGFDPVYSTGVRDDYFSYYWDSDLPVTISGYETFFRMRAYLYKDGQNSYEKEITTDRGKVKLIYDQQNRLIIEKDEAEIYQYEMRKFVKGLYDKYGVRIDRTPKLEAVSSTDQERMIFTDETDKVKIMIIFNNISGKIDLDQNELGIDNIDADIFLKFKDG